MCERILPVISNNISHLKNFMQIMRYIYMHWVWSSGGSTVLRGLDLPLFIPWYMDVSKLESTERLRLWGNFTFTSRQTHFHVYIYWVVFLTLLTYTTIHVYATMSELCQGKDITYQIMSLLNHCDTLEIDLSYSHC